MFILEMAIIRLVYAHMRAIASIQSIGRDLLDYMYDFYGKKAYIRAVSDMCLTKKISRQYKIKSILHK